MKLIRADGLDAIIAAALYSAVITAAVSHFEHESVFREYREGQSRDITSMVMNANIASNHWGICDRELAQIEAAYWIKMNPQPPSYIGFSFPQVLQR